MAKGKDIAEKIFFDIDEVFADILNVLLFGGKELISPDALAPTGQRSQLKIGREIHEQERDVSKLWMKGRVRFALLGLENEWAPGKLLEFQLYYKNGKEYCPVRACALGKQQSKSKRVRSTSGNPTTEKSLENSVRCKRFCGSLYLPITIYLRDKPP